MAPAKRPRPILKLALEGAVPASEVLAGEVRPVEAEGSPPPSLDGIQSEVARREPTPPSGRRPA